MLIDDKEVHFGPKEFKLLKHFIVNEGRVFSRSLLLDPGEGLYMLRKELWMFTSASEIKFRAIWSLRINSNSKGF